MNGFENLAVRQEVADGTRLECGIRWTVYGPAHGNEFVQVTPGTPFAALPEDWHCRNRDAPKNASSWAIES
ncbi:rubredoxin [Bradyrhizobium sp. UFLA05-112]